jgi:PAS domain S-box-containing protein
MFAKTASRRSDRCGVARSCLPGSGELFHATLLWFYCVLMAPVGTLMRKALFQSLCAIDQAVLDGIPAALYVCSPDGAVVRCNCRAVELWGRSLSSAPQMMFGGALKLYQLDGHPLAHGDGPMGVALRTGEPRWDDEVVIERPDGSRIIVLVNVELLRGPTGELEGAVASFQDITGRKRIEDALNSRVDEQAALYEFSNQLQRAASFPDIHEAALDAIIRALRCQRASILLRDAAGEMRFVAWRGLSADYRRAVEGHSPWPHAAEDPQPVAINDVEGSDLDASLKAIVRAEGIGALAFIPLVTDAKLVGKFMAYYAARHTFTDAELSLALTIARQLGSSIERMHAQQARRCAERELRREQELLQTIIDRIPVMVTRYEPDKKVMHLNPAFSRTVGWSAAEVAGLSLMEACYPDPDYRKHVSEFMDSCRGGWMDIRMRTRDDREVETMWANIRLSDQTLVGIGIDITDRKRDEAQRELLVAELSHRVKNTLATVISIAHQSFAKGRSPREAQHSFDDRIRALAQTHTRLAETNWSGVALETVIRDETAPYQDRGRNVRIVGPQIILNPKCAVSFGMAIHELTTNAAKYGALSNRGGSLDVAWQIAPADKEVQLRWIESGGPAVRPPQHSGFGRVLLERAMAADLNGDVQLDFVREGLRCRIVFPLESHWAAPSDELARGFDADPSRSEKQLGPPPTPASSSHADEALRGKRVLLVEDEFFLRLELEEWLRSAGCAIIGPFSALQPARRLAARGEPIDLAILDANLNGEMVYPLADDLLARSVPVIFLTGYERASLPARFRVVPQVSKPYDPAALIKEIRSSLGWH